MRRAQALLMLLLMACSRDPTPVAPGPKGPDAAPGDADGARPADPIRRTFVEVDGVRVRVRDAGAALGAPVLLLHGGKYHSGTWEELGTLTWLARRGVHAVAVDLPGFGETPAIDGDRGEFLAALLEALALERPVIVFPSMSGSFAIPFLIAHPDRVRGAVPVAPVGVERLADLDAPLQVPALVCWGERDELFPASGAPALRSRFAQGRVLILRGAAHAAYLDATEEFHRALLDFAMEGVAPEDGG